MPGGSPRQPRALPTLLDRLLQAEASLRQRHGLGLLVATMIGTLAVADAWLWPEISLAPGYVVPITLGAYAFGMRLGVELSVLCAILRVLCAGHAYGPWWLYAGSVLMLSEYLLLALGVGLLGRAVRRIERHARVLGRLSAVAGGLTTALDPEAIVRQSVESSVLLTGADGGFAATAGDAGWCTEAVFRHGCWHAQNLVWWPHAAGPWEAGSASGAEEPATPQQLGARVQLVVPIPSVEGRPALAIVVFRGAPHVFERPTREVLELFALHVAAALKAATLYRAAVEATEEKARMLACVAHDLRNPLHGLLWDTDTLRAENGGRKELERMNDNALLALHLVRTLQEFAAIEGRQLSVSPQPVPLARVFDDLQATVGPLISGRPIEFRSRVAAGAETPVSDPYRLQQILGNLLANAAKFTERGAIELAAERPSAEIVISVRDTGIGIEPSELRRVFEPFYRGRARAIGPAPGMGLGLAIARELAGLLGGRLEVESEFGRGSTFRLRLPAEGPPAQTGALPAHDAPMTAASPRGAVVLLVDDDGQHWAVLAPVA